MTSTAPADLAAGEPPVPRAAAEALAAADQVAAAAGLVVSELSSAPDHEAAEGVLSAGTPAGSDAMQGDVVRALSHAGGYVAGARRGEQLVAAAVAFHSPAQAPGHGPQLFAYQCSVLPEARGRGAGRALMLHLRAWSLARGVQAAGWVLDPSDRAAAGFSLSGVGACGVSFLPEFFGEDQDRVLCRWDLAGAGAGARSGTGQARPVPDLAELLAGGAGVVLDAGPDGRPVPRPVNGSPVRLVRVPEQSGVPGLRAEWAAALRAALEPAFENGFVLTTATRAGWYVLEELTP